MNFRFSLSSAVGGQHHHHQLQRSGSGRYGAAAAAAAAFTCATPAGSSSSSSPQSNLLDSLESYDSGLGLGTSLLFFFRHLAAGNETRRRMGLGIKSMESVGGAI